MASRDELDENEVLKKPSKVARGKKANLMGFPRVVRIYITYNDGTNSSSDERKIIEERSPNDKKNLQRNYHKRQRGVGQRKWGRLVAEIRDVRMNKRHWLGSFTTADAAALAYDKASIEIKGPSAFTNILTPPSKESDSIHH
ncbi:hypothetical protein EJD97_024519 [Solanum chilense]|uniref:AP2/ERF domain-containing protein n=1 Tax=Solanum chilense TaxID=4083 RepID=A0A6N2C4N4_SOLCI|nr:hypothetical protein EJD97_024519 [Solanum chilense]